MYNVIYEREVQFKLASLNEELIEKQGEQKGLQTISDIVASLDNLSMFPRIGQNIRDIFQVDCPENWYILYIKKNYFVFSITKTDVIVLKMYNEKQDFIHELFGIETRSNESIEYWGE